MRSRLAPPSASGGARAAPGALPSCAQDRPAGAAPRRGGQRVLLWAAAACGLAGCSVPELPMQRAAPAAWAPGLAGGEACVVENPAVGLDLLAYLRAALAERGFAVRQLPPGSPPTACATTVYYTGSWSRDAAARVLGTAQLRVWRGGRMASEAIYDATRSSLLDLRRYRGAEARIDAMVGQLFPAAAGGAAPAPAPAAAQAQAPVPMQAPLRGADPLPAAGPQAPAAATVPSPVPAAVPAPVSGPIFIPGPGEKLPPATAPAPPTATTAPGGGGRTTTPY
ncbi:MAG: hypothetical protein PGN26_12945 [Xylophilus ampelinus]